MKKLMKIMVLALVLTVLSTIILNASSIGRPANDQAKYLDDDPNEPEFANVLTGILFSSLDDDPNDPGPEFASAN
jgi:hypothetical protein